MYENQFVARLAQVFSQAGAKMDGNEQSVFGYVLNENDAWATEAHIGWKSTNQTIRGTKIFKFNRLNLLYLFKNVQPVLYIYNAHKLSEIIDALIKKYQLPVIPFWFENYNDNVDGNHLEYSVQLDFANNVWTRPSVYGQQRYWLTVKVIQPNMNIGELFLNNKLSAPTLPYVIRAGYTNTELLTIGVDFTPREDDDYRKLISIKNTADMTDDQSTDTAPKVAALIKIITDRLGIEVTTTPDVDGALSLAGAKFVYNGDAGGISQADTSYDRILVFDTDTDPASTKARTYRGRVFIHYNNTI